MLGRFAKGMPEGDQRCRALTGCSDRLLWVHLYRTEAARPAWARLVSYGLTLCRLLARIQIQIHIHSQTQGLLSHSLPQPIQTNELNLESSMSKL